MPELIKDTIAHEGGTKNRGVTGSYNFNSDGIPAKNWQEIYQVLGDTPLETEENILGTTGLPILGQPNRDAWCVHRSARCVDDSAKLWEVTCKYASDVSIRVMDSTHEKDPDNFPGVYWPRRLDQVAAIINWTSGSIQEPLIQDAQDLDDTTGDLKKVANTMREPLYPPVERTIPVLNIDWFIVQDTRTISYNWEEEFVNKINESPFMGAPIGSVLCSSLEMSPTGDIPYYSGLMPEDPNDPPNLLPPRFWHMHAQFKFRFWYVYSCYYNYLMPDPNQQGWILKLLNQGNTMKKKKRPDQPSNDESENVGAAAIDKAPVRANLDMDGFPLDPTEDPIWLDFNRFPKTDFDALVDPAILWPYDSWTIPDVPAPAPCS